MSSQCLVSSNVAHPPDKVQFNSETVQKLLINFWCENWWSLQLHCRQTVKMLLSILDPEGVARWRRHRLIRRIYQYNLPSFKFVLTNFVDASPHHACRVQTLFGTWMAMTNSSLTDLQYMDVSMGMWYYGLTSSRTRLLLICRYSRKVLWLKLASTNNNPKVILWHYLLKILQTKGYLAIDGGHESHTCFCFVQDAQHL